MEYEPAEKNMGDLYLIQKSDSLPSVGQYYPVKTTNRKISLIPVRNLVLDEEIEMMLYQLKTTLELNSF